MEKIARAILLTITLAVLPASASAAPKATKISLFKARPPIHIFKANQSQPQGMSPDKIKKIYNLPADGGQGTIAIIGAYDSPQIEKDLGTFDTTFNLAACTSKNGCLERHKMSSAIKTDSGWGLETALDVEWSHAIAPRAKILLVEAVTASGDNLLAAVDYARQRPDVVAISMSWGGPEFSDEASLDQHFTSKFGATFFASSGDNGWGVSWPAVSPNVVGVGGTTIKTDSTGKLISETAWNGSGGGVSKYVTQPDYQKTYDIKKAASKRAVPDVSYDSDPASGFAVYKSGPKKGSWYVLGGTSAGAPQWAAIKALGNSADNAKFYGDKSATNNASFFRDITSGTNGSCQYFCDARRHYDYVTGLGSPLTTKF